MAFEHFFLSFIESNKSYLSYNIPEMNFLLVCSKAFSPSYAQLASIQLVNVIHDNIPVSQVISPPESEYRS